MLGRNFQILLIIEYAIISVCYLFGKDWARAMYFLGAIILTVGILFIK